MSVILAFDFGGTNTRAALLDQTGQVITEHAAPQDIPGGPAVTEVDPAHWWRLFCQSVEALAEDHAFEAVRGIALTGMTRTQVFLDVAGAVIRPAMTFRDSRAVEEAAKLASLAPEGWAERGQLNAFHPAARLAWLATHEPQHMARLHTVLDPKDYLNFRLTGRAATDAISAARLLAVMEGPEAVRIAMGLPATATIAPALAPTAVLGPVLADLPGALSRLAGCPVFVMTHDTWAAVAGLGALQPGLAYNISGTTEVTGVIGTEPVEAPGLPLVAGLPLVDWGPGLQQIGGPSQSGADSVAWFLGLLAAGDTRQAGEKLEQLLQSPRDEAPALFLPFLHGERVPYWNPHLRAAWLGLNRRHGPADLAWAVLEGVAFLNRTVLARAETALGAPVREIRCGGGGAASAAWCQIKADVTGRPVVVGRAAQPGLLGCAAVAWTGLGAFPDLGQAQQALFHPARRHEPNPARHAAYAPLHQAWTQAVATLQEQAEAVASLRAPPALAQ
ncbi:FGGY-family carbohydrate kinase [Roseomonas aerophila]|uniref:FGGY-family carbohydrate kinase n=1 Tax=Teichococcus aerophilus TaxID=1224513 RepID=A0ABR7RG87_9PROT|nr:FGGY-family carbohydrate kinase [Pseudoroseomonas aerophila]MBC9205581.1 FGGY-family carbohydrate kinase [Pseudoroseomonas aerophila]